MCVAVPGRIVSIDEHAGASRPAQVVFGDGAPVDADLVMLPDVGVGDYVIVHSGYAISKVGRSAAAETLSLLDQT